MFRKHSNIIHNNALKLGISKYIHTNIDLLLEVDIYRDKESAVRPLLVEDASQTIKLPMIKSIV